MNSAASAVERQGSNNEVVNVSLDRRDPDVVVVGAGPAGSVASLVMARSGLNVVMVDRAAFPRDKACGDLLLPRAVNVLRDLGIMGILDAALPVPRQRSVSAGDLNRRHDGVRVRSERAVHIIPRRDFDMQLVTSAVDAGVTLLHGQVTDIAQTPGSRPSVTALVRSNGSSTDHEESLTLRPRFIVGADGATSRTAQLIGARTAVPHAQAFAFRCYAQAASPNLGEHLDFVVDLSAFGNTEAYGWVFPTSAEAANVGVCLWGPSVGSRAASALDELFQILPDLRPDLPRLTPSSRPIGGFIRFDAATVSRVVGDVVLVGDAAGLTQPASGEGISYALRSGVLAAQTITAVTEGTGRLEDYETAVSRDLLPGIAAGLVNLQAGITVASSSLIDSAPVETQSEPAESEPDGIAESELIRRSSGVLVASMGDQIVAVDTVNAAAHLIEASAGWLLMYDEPMTVDAIVDDLAPYADVPISHLRINVAEAIEWLRSRSLIGRERKGEPPRPWRGTSLAADGRASGVGHPVFDEVVAFRSRNSELLADIDEYLSGGIPNATPTRWVDVDTDRFGEVVVTAEHEQRFANESECLRGLVDILDECARRACGLAVLKAAAVRGPSGEVWVLFSTTDLDRSAVTASLVRAGYGYLGDEYIGIRPDTLQAVAYPTPLRAEAEHETVVVGRTPPFPRVPAHHLTTVGQALHGDHGPIRGLLFVEHQPDQPAAASRLPPTEALEALLAAAANLAGMGEPALQALCDLATNTPAIQVRHYDAAALARVLATNGISALDDSLDGDLRRERRRLDSTASDPRGPSSTSLRIRRATDVDWAIIEADGVPCVIARTPSTPACGLTGQALDLWLRLESETSFEVLVYETADSTGGSDHLAARDVSWLLSQFAEIGLVVQGEDRSSSTAFSQAAARFAPSGPTDAATASLVRAREIPQLRPDDGRVRWDDWASAARAYQVAGTVVVTDHAETCRALEDIPGTRKLTPSSLATSGEARIEVRSLPCHGTGVIVRTGSRLDWYPPESVLSGLALAVGAQVCNPSVRPLFATSTRWLFVDADGRPLAPDEDRARRWLCSGRASDRFDECLTPVSDLTLRVDKRESELAMWLHTVELSASRSTSDPTVLLRFLGANHVSSVEGDDLGRTVLVNVTSRAPLQSPLAEMDQPVDASAGVVATVGLLRHSGDPPSTVQDPLSPVPQWAAKLGKVSHANASAKISVSGITVGRPLVAVRIGDGRDDAPQTDDVEVQRIGRACREIGLPAEWAVEAATAAVTAGEFFVGEQQGPSGAWRRKLYVNQPSESMWQWLSVRWPDHLAETSHLPTWAAWKWSNVPGTAAERSVEFGHLGGAATVGEVVNPTLELMGRDWADVIGHLISSLHLADGDRPSQGDCLTLDEGGRRTVDLSARGRNRNIVLSELEPELRWLAAVAGHDRAAADGLIKWADTGRLSVLIFGTDGNGDPFVNLYISQP